MSQIIMDFVNVVSSCDTKTVFDFDVLMDVFPNAEYNPDTFRGLIIRNTHPKSTISIFRTGKVTSAGSKSQEQSISVLEKVLEKMIQHSIIPNMKYQIDITNMVVLVNLQKSIKITKLAKSIPKCMYEPEQFSGVIMRHLSPSATVLIFSTGKIICVGARNEEDIQRVINSILFTLREKELIYE